MQIIIDADVPTETAAAIASLDAAAERLEGLRAAYFAAEDAANRLDATQEQLEAWRAAEAAFHEALRATGVQPL